MTELTPTQIYLKMQELAPKIEYDFDTERLNIGIDFPYQLINSRHYHNSIPGLKVILENLVKRIAQSERINPTT